MKEFVRNCLNSSTFSESLCDFPNKNDENYGSSWNGIIVFHADVIRSSIILRDTAENSMSQPEQTYQIANEMINVMEYFVTDFKEGIVH